MEVKRDWFEELIFRGAAARRFTQDSPVLPDVWLEYARTYCKGPPEPVDLLLTPHRDASAAELAHALRHRLSAERKTARWKKAHAGAATQPEIAYHLSSVAARLHFDELVRVVMPLSAWWHQAFHGSRMSPLSGPTRKLLVTELRRFSPDGEDGRPEARAPRKGEPRISPDLVWTVRIVGSILLARDEKEPGSRAKFEAITRRYADLIDAFARLVTGMPPADRPVLWAVSRNREVRLAIARSTLAVKADAARRLFEVDTRNLAWAVLDSGIDARHPAFRRPPKDANRGNVPRAAAADGPANSRIVATFDFTNIRRLLDVDAAERPAAVPRRAARPPKGRGQGDNESFEQRAKDLTRRLQRGGAIDWDELTPFLEVPHDRTYHVPLSEHGTHVAGILAGNWKEEGLVGMCPDLSLYDFRVFDDAERGNEFTVMAALQFIRYFNSNRDQAAIHGANLSLSLSHDVANYACGRTPVCDECERVVNSGVVVVAAAGNEGYGRFITPSGDSEGYRSISISDPGNADEVITVGATHRYEPHTYGVSYFSSRGPTGDGRLKPDLVAPGEKITAPVPNEQSAIKDGTSMAAPHVSGAAALLMARHRELVGRPKRVKEILCSTATDLGRERYFQGHGMLDVLRALQSV